MKNLKIYSAILAAVILIAALTPLRTAVVGYVRVNFLKVGTEEQNVWLPASAAKSLRVDSWKVKRALQTPVLTLNLYNGSDWVVTGVEVIVTTGSERRSFRCAPRVTAEYNDTFLSGALTYLTPMKAGVAVCEIGDFITEHSSVTVEGFYGWKP